MILTRIIELEAEISATIHKDNNCTVTFDYQIGEGITDKATKVSAYTYNPHTKEFFLLYSVFGKDKLTCLEALLNYVKTHATEMNSYSVEWARKCVVPLEHFTSYFYAQDVRGVVEKFFAGKDAGAYVVYEIKLNPSA